MLSIFSSSPSIHKDSLPGFWEWDLENKTAFSTLTLRESVGYDNEELSEEWNFWEGLIYKLSKAGMDDYVSKSFRQLNKPGLINCKHLSLDDLKLN